jgi:hypothetical protein
MPLHRVSVVSVALLATVFGATALAQNESGGQTGGQEELPEKVDRLERENRDLKQRVERLERGDVTLDQELERLGAPGTGRAPAAVEGDEQAPRLSAEGLKLAESGLSQAFGGIYTKPFLASAHGIALGGYVDLEYRDPEDDDRDLRFHRLIPFIYAQPSEHVRFATEIEIEDGHEVEVEFAVIDLLWDDLFNVRAGVILTPLGKFNLVHDSPANELTDRPLVSTTVIPSTLREAGFGAFGLLASADSTIGQLSYEAYATTGFKGLLDDGTAGFDTTDGLKDGRPHEELGSERSFEDINNSFAGVGRLAWSPLLGTELGLSAHAGKYDESGRDDLTILAIDAALDGSALARLVGADGAAAKTLSGFELLGEAAHARLERDALARASGIPSRMQGWYAQLNYRIYPAFLQSLIEAGRLDSGSHFTLVVRRDDIDLDGFERERWTFGVNFRPNRYQTVIKFDYQINTESGRTAEVKNDAFVASIATYF